MSANAWTLFAAFGLFGGVLLALSAGHFGVQLKEAGIPGAFALLLAGIVLMWKNEHLQR